MRLSAAYGLLWSPMTIIHPTIIHPTNDPTIIGQLADHLPSRGIRQTDIFDEGSTEASNTISQASGFDHLPACGQASRATLVNGFTRLISDRVDLGWSCHLVTILFSQFPGPKKAVMDQIKDEVQRVYSTLLTRVHRKPRSAATDELPLLVGALDLRVYKRDRSSIANDFCNGGLHFHAVVLIPPRSRLKESLAEHFQANHGLYEGPTKCVQRIHVLPVTHDHSRVVDYVLKTVSNGRLSYDDAVLVLPRARQELRPPSVRLCH